MLRGGRFNGCTNPTHGTLICKVYACALFGFSSPSVYVDGVIVGAVCCRIEPPKSSGGHDALYIMTLGVLATWRRRGIGTQLLRRVLASLPRYPSIGEIYLHVQTKNDEATGFYQVKFRSCVENTKNFALWKYEDTNIFSRPLDQHFQQNLLKFLQ